MPIIIDDLGFDPKNYPDGVWGEPVEGTKIQVRRIDADIVTELRKPFIKKTMEVDRRTKQVVPVERVIDDEGFNDAIIDYLIQDFRGFVDKTEIALPVNLENKKRIMKKALISEWVFSMANSLEVAEKEAEREEEKNL